MGYGTHVNIPLLKVLESESLTSTPLDVVVLGQASRCCPYFTSCTSNVPSTNWSTREVREVDLNPQSNIARIAHRCTHTVYPIFETSKFAKKTPSLG